MQSNLSDETLNLLYQSAQEVSLTSLCQVIPSRTVVGFDAVSGHLQTREIPDIDDFYDHDYKILLESEDEDQLYISPDNRKIFRTQHQWETLQHKLQQHQIALPADADVLDFGCAKAATLKKWHEAQTHRFVPHVFDVSEMYRPFWNSWIAPENQAVYATPDAWNEKFPLITSFFALEHVAQPLQVLAHVHSLLQDGGVFYAIVPDIAANIGDFVVVDHVNHFSPQSWHYALSRCGFEVLEVDTVSHRAAQVVVARKTNAAKPYTPPAAEIAILQQRAEEMATYWSAFAQRVQQWEREHHGQKIAIYGSGFYGAFIAICLQNPAAISCFFDRNPFRQRHTLMEKPILAPENLPSDIDAVLIALNPQIARAAIAELQQSDNHWARIEEFFWT